MALVDTSDLISISEANKLGVSGLVRAAEEGREHVLLRNNKPVAGVVSMKRLEQLQQIQEDLIDASLAAARMHHRARAALPRRGARAVWLHAR